jgi:hypothetical protein
MARRSWEPAADAERLTIPSPFFVWMHKLGKDYKGRPRYDSLFCPPQRDAAGYPGTKDVSILIDDRMILDHMNPEYERAVNSNLERIVRNDGPGYAFSMC